MTVDASINAEPQSAARPAPGTAARRPAELGSGCAFAPWADPDAVPLVEIDAVTKRYGDAPAIDDLTMKIYEREFFALLGPSGCGKTTLMRMLAGFEDPSAGEIRLAGRTLTDQPPNERPVNMMFQSYALFPHLSVEKNIAFGLKRDGMPKAEIARRVEEMIALVQLGGFAKRRPHQLSGGQRQRVALARALAKKPKLLLLDEPLGALDKKLRQETQFELMTIQEELGATFMIVTHDQEEAMTVASRIAVMDKGRVAQVATPREIYERPATRYVADFIGDVNLIEGTLERTAQTGRARLRWREDASPIEVAVASDAVQSGARAWLAVRPEKLSISPSAPEPGSADNAIAGTVLDIAYVGPVTTYHVEVRPGVVIKAQEANFRHAHDRGVTWDDAVWLTWSADAGALVDA